MNLANRLTLVRVIVVPVVAAVYYLDWQYARAASAVLFLAAAATDLIDGLIARRMNTITAFGKFLDPIADKLLVCTMLIILCADRVIHPVIVAVIVARELTVDCVRLMAALGRERMVIAASWPGKVKTDVQTVTVTFLLLDNWPFSLLGLPVTQVLVWLMLAVTLYSGVDYVVRYRRVFLENK